MSLEAPNSIKFISPTDNTKKNPTYSLEDSIKFKHMFDQSSKKYPSRVDYSPKPPKRDTTWLEYQNGQAQSIDDSLEKLKQPQQKTLLKFSNVTPKNQGMITLFKSLENQPQVKHLIIRHSSLSQQQIMQLERVLQINDGIAWLVLDHNDIDSRGVQHISKGLEDNKGVIHVVLGDNKISNKGAKDISGMLSKNHHIKTLFLQGNNIGDEGINSLRHAIQNRPPLSIIDVRDNPINDEYKQLLKTTCNQLNITCYTS